jgi:hypothetical protein
MPFCTPKASDLVLVTHPDTQVHSSTELKRAAVSVFLTGGFCLDDELEYLHLNPREKGWGIGPRGSRLRTWGPGFGIQDRGLGAQDELSAISFRLTTGSY